MMTGHSSGFPAPPGNVIVIGASTGGTRVLVELFAALPPLAACVIVVQHMPKFINASLCRSLDGQGPMPVRLAEDGDRLQEGAVWIAPSDCHCHLVGNAAIRLGLGPKVNWVRPAIDVTMQSLCLPPPGGRIIGVLLTGMGSDGALGLAHIKTLGGLTIAQDEKSCAIHGMPAAAVKLGCVDHQLPPAEIAALLGRLLGAGAPSYCRPRPEPATV